MVDSLNDLARIDFLQVDRRDPEVSMSELAMGDRAAVGDQPRPRVSPGRTQDSGLSTGRSKRTRAAIAPTLPVSWLQLPERSRLGGMGAEPRTSGRAGYLP